MSVEEKLIRLAPPAFESLQQKPATLMDVIEESIIPTTLIPAVSSMDLFALMFRRLA